MGHALVCGLGDTSPPPLGPLFHFARFSVSFPRAVDRGNTSILSILIFHSQTPWSKLDESTRAQNEMRDINIAFGQLGSFGLSAFSTTSLSFSLPFPLLLPSPHSPCRHHCWVVAYLRA